MEVILIASLANSRNWGFLHVCGGDPETSIFIYDDSQFSPRMWRWSSLLKTAGHYHQVFSTYVEVILFGFVRLFHTICFLHVCGGDPLPSNLMSFISKFSPRMWRWSTDAVLAAMQVIVFSTYVEVILRLRCIFNSLVCFLHVCGGDPTTRYKLLIWYLFSPRMWRWSYQCLYYHY